MGKPRVNVTQLIQRDPGAWTTVLRRHEGLDDLTVTAVAGEPLLSNMAERFRPHLVRYTLTLDGYQDAITCIVKQTTTTEARFYQELAALYPQTPTCWFAEVLEDGSWIILDDVPDHRPPPQWTPDDAQDIIHQLAALHAPSWDQSKLLNKHDWLTHLISPMGRPYQGPSLQHIHGDLLTEGPGAMISEHAIFHAGHLAPQFLQAANGLAIMRSLGGWPGILGESHLAAAADLLDDPVPVLDRLRRLPVTLLHGRPHNYHWHLTLFGDQRLLDWQQVCIGPGVWDLVCFVEKFDLLYRPELPWRMAQRTESPATEETLVDSYLLAMRARLGKEFNARELRMAIPAARCLQVLIDWFPHFATWFAEMPNTYTWQKVNRMNDQELVGTRFEPIIGYRGHLQQVFARFLHAYHQL